MKLNFFLILVPFLFTDSFAISQVVSKYEVKAIYNMKYQPDSTDNSAKKEETMFLYIGDNGSKFASEGKSVADSLMSDKSHGLSFAQVTSMIPPTEFDYNIIKRYDNNQIIFLRKIVNNKISYSESLELFSWKIKPERKTILGYNCQKAVTNYEGRIYEAWFTMDIPISEGPYKFNGLPGLIIQIADLKNHYNFKLIAFEKLETSISDNTNIKDYSPTTKAKFMALEKRYKENPFSVVEQSGVQVEFNDPSQKARMMNEYKEQIKKQNNPIELTLGE